MGQVIGSEDTWTRLHDVSLLIDIAVWKEHVEMIVTQWPSGFPICSHFTDNRTSKSQTTGRQGSNTRN